jgi:hypothetical protein
MKEKSNLYIFLDIDGVISTPNCIKDGMWALDPDKQKLLGIILDATGANIVLTSCWRKSTLEDSIKYMNDEGFMFCDKIVGITIRGYHFLQKGINLNIPRGVEIKQWLDTHAVYPWHAYPERTKEYEIYDNNGKFIKMNSNKLGKDFNYVILDDDIDMLLEHAKRFIRCDSMIGLTIEQVQQAIEILLKK